LQTKVQADAQSRLVSCVALGAQAQGMLHAKGQKTSAGGFGRWPAHARDGANHAPVAVACGSGQEERETEGDGGRQLDKT